MGRAIVAGGKPAMETPVGALNLSSLAVGSIVKINENSTPIEFYVAKHDYESALNGTGRTLLVRKEVFDLRGWNGNATNEYAGSTSDTWLNGDYLDLFDATTQDIIGVTEFYYSSQLTQGQVYDVTTLNRAVFQLSVTELGLSATYANVEGTELPIASELQIAYSGSTKRAQWTRTAKNVSDGSAAYYVKTTGSATTYSVTTKIAYSRPCFTLPATALFDEETLEFKGVA